MTEQIELKTGVYTYANITQADITSAFRTDFNAPNKGYPYSPRIEREFRPAALPRTTFAMSIDFDLINNHRPRLRDLPTDTPFRDILIQDLHGPTITYPLELLNCIITRQTENESDSIALAIEMASRLGIRVGSLAARPATLNIDSEWGSDGQLFSIYSWEYNNSLRISSDVITVPQRLTPQIQVIFKYASNARQITLHD